MCVVASRNLFPAPRLPGLSVAYWITNHNRIVQPDASSTCIARSAVLTTAPGRSGFRCRSVVIKLPRNQSDEAHWVPREESRAGFPCGRPPLDAFPQRAGVRAESLMSMCLARRGPVQHLHFIGIDMGRDSPCISRQPKGNCRPAWNYVCNRDAPRLRRENNDPDHRPMLQRPAWLRDRLAAGNRADGPEALSKLATAGSVATGRAAFKYVISLGVAQLMYSSTLVL